jgi:hypothetical protein
MLTAPAARDQVQSGCRYRSPGVAAHSGIDICPDDAVNLNLPSIILDIRDVELARSRDEQAQP